MDGKDLSSLCIYSVDDACSDFFMYFFNGINDRRFCRRHRWCHDGALSVVNRLRKLSQTESISRSLSRLIFGF